MKLLNVLSVILAFQLFIGGAMPGVITISNLLKGEHVSISVSEDEEAAFDPSMTIQNFIEQAEKFNPKLKEDYSKSNCILVCNGKKVALSDTLKGCGVTDVKGAEIYVTDFYVTVKSNEGNAYIVAVKSDSSLADLMQSIERQTGLSVANKKMFFGGEQLPCTYNPSTGVYSGWNIALADYNIKNKSTINFGFAKHISGESSESSETSDSPSSSRLYAPAAAVTLALLAVSAYYRKEIAKRLKVMWKKSKKHGAKSKTEELNATESEQEESK